MNRKQKRYWPGWWWLLVTTAQLSAPQCRQPVVRLPQPHQKQDLTTTARARLAKVAKIGNDLVAAAPYALNEICPAVWQTLVNYVFWSRGSSEHFAALLTALAQEDSVANLSAALQDFQAALAALQFLRDHWQQPIRGSSCCWLFDQSLASHIAASLHNPLLAEDYYFFQLLQCSILQLQVIYIDQLHDMLARAIRKAKPVRPRTTPARGATVPAPPVAPMAANTARLPSPTVTFGGVAIIDTESVETPTSAKEED